MLHNGEIFTYIIHYALLGLVKQGTYTTQGVVITCFQTSWHSQ